MPLIHSSSAPAFKTNVKTLMGEIGKSPHVKSREQGLAIAYAIKRRGHADGGEVTEDSITADFARQAAADRTRRAVTHRPAFAFGGPPAPWFVRNEARGLGTHSGPILSAVAGRTDHHPMNVKAGSYVFPSEHVASIGQGNTLAGMKQLGAMFNSGPYGTKPMGTKHGMGPPKPPHLRHIATGGASDHGGARGHGHPVPIAAAGGEFVAEPDQILDWLERNGFPRDLKFGHQALDAWVMSQRKKHIRTLKGLPPPAKG